MKDEEVVKIAKKLVVYGVLVIIAMIILFGSVYTIDAGDRGILLTFGKPTGNVIGSGLHFKIPLAQSVIITSVRTQTIQFDNGLNAGTASEYTSLQGASKDLQDVAIGSVVNYHINERDVLDIYQKYGDEQTYEKNILEPLVRETVKAETAQYTAEELNTKRAEFSDKVGEILTVKFAKVSGVFEKYNVVNFEYSPTFTTAIEQKAVQTQLLEKSRIELETAQVQASTRIAQAQGEAEAIKIQVNAINQQGGANYVQLQMIQKWNGQMPYSTGGNSIFDMRNVGLGQIVATTNSTN